MLGEMRDSSYDPGSIIKAGGNRNVTSMETDRAGANLLEEPTRDGPMRLIRPDVVSAGIDEGDTTEGQEGRYGRDGGAHTERLPFLQKGTRRLAGDAIQRPYQPYG